MEIKDALSKIDSLLKPAPAPRFTEMTRKGFDEYVEREIAKAKAEAEEADDEKTKKAKKPDDESEGAKKAKKRLTHLRKVVARVEELVTKAEGQYAPEAWSYSTLGTAPIPEYELGYEDTTRKTEVSDEGGGNGTNLGKDGVGTQGDDTIFANWGDITGKNPQNSGGADLGQSGSGTQGEETIFSNPGDEFSKNPMTALGKLQKAIADILPAAPEAKTKTQKNAPAGPGFDWPGNVADKDFMKTGVFKNAPEWGRDDTKPPAK